MLNRFENLIVIGRPGSGKSEIVDLIRRTPLQKRIIYFHVGDFIELDDFVWLSEKFKEDAVWEQLGLPRKHSKRVTDGVVVTDAKLWDYCMEVFNREIAENYLSDRSFYDRQSIFIEFSRGGEKGYLDSLDHLSDDILSRSAVLHLDIDYEEALRRNELRYQKDKGDSKLHHKVPLEEMEKSYKTSDWEAISAGKDEGLLRIRDINVPFINLKNQPAPRDEAELLKRVTSSLHTLFIMKYGDRPWSSRIDRKSGALREVAVGTFDHLFVFGRPASGKSEFIDFIKKTEAKNRASVFHVGPIEEIDDYKMLVEKFREDDIWARLLGRRRYTTLDGDTHIVSDLSLYHFAAHLVDQVILNRYLPNAEFYYENTLLVEFSRGGEVGYGQTLRLFNPDVLRKAAIIYINTSFDECWRRNVARYDEKRKFSILAHMIPRTQMERLYRQDDWAQLTGAQEKGIFTVGDVRIPFVTMDNEIESKDSNVLGERYKAALDDLIFLYHTSRKE